MVSLLFFYSKQHSDSSYDFLTVLHLFQKVESFLVYIICYIIFQLQNIYKIMNILLLLLLFTL